MTSLARKIKRKMASGGSTVNMVDELNNELVKEALTTGAKHIISLHSTKGFRSTSTSRLNYVGPTGYMWAIIKDMIVKNGGTVD